MSDCSRDQSLAQDLASDLEGMAGLSMTHPSVTVVENRRTVSPDPSGNVGTRNSRLVSW